MKGLSYVGTVCLIIFFEIALYTLAPFFETEDSGGGGDGADHSNVTFVIPAPTVFKDYGRTLATDDINGETNQTREFLQECRSTPIQRSKDVSSAPYELKKHKGVKTLLYKRSAQRQYVTPPKVRVGCLYSGFMRDYKRMLMECERVRSYKWCKNQRLRKFYGNQMNGLIRALDCDVFISTWDLYGKGKFNTNEYDFEDRVNHRDVCEDYGDHLAVLHVQEYFAYHLLWSKMSKEPRNFTEAYPLMRGNQERGILWRSFPIHRNYFRSNDYSQSYKNWILFKIVEDYMRSHNAQYDLFYRTRPDIRMSNAIVPRSLKKFAYSANLILMTNTTDTQHINVFQFEIADDPFPHVIRKGRIHVAAPDFSDFGFFGVPDDIRQLSLIWVKYCDVAPLKAELFNRFTRRPKPTGMAALYYITEAQSKPTTSPEDARERGEVIDPFLDWDVAADYNRVLWHDIFTARYIVDIGPTYLHVSRRYGEIPV